MFLGLGQVFCHQVRLSDIFVRPQKPRIDLQRALVVFKRRLKLSGIAIGKAQRVVDVGVVRIALIGGGYHPEPNASAPARCANWP